MHTWLPLVAKAGADLVQLVEENLEIAASGVGFSGLRVQEVVLDGGMVIMLSMSAGSPQGPAYLPGNQLHACQVPSASW